MPLLWFLGPSSPAPLRERTSAERAGGSTVLWAVTHRGVLSFDALLEATGLSEDALVAELDWLVDEELIDASADGFLATDLGRRYASTAPHRIRPPSGWQPHVTQRLDGRQGVAPAVSYSFGRR